METVHVELGLRSYPVALSESSRGFGAFARSRAVKASTAVVLTDSNVWPIADHLTAQLIEEGFRTWQVSLPPGEQTKSLDHAGSLYDRLADVNADRQTLIVAVGGGVVGDLSGFVAATYNRGLPLLLVPTTLLSMVDSSVGGKVGINHPKGKNLIGAFHQPVGVWIDPAALESLPKREYRSGLAEVVKYGVILDAGFFEELEANRTAILAREPKAVKAIVARSCRLKADVVEKDEREETGVRAKLNYGHTFAHAFETVGGYGSWLHGEAVAAGMICASRLAEKLGRIRPDVTERQVKLLKEFGLPVSPKAEWSTDELIAVMRRDKKAVAGTLRFVLPTKLGEVELVGGVPELLVAEVLHELAQSSR